MFREILPIIVISSVQTLSIDLFVKVPYRVAMILHFCKIQLIIFQW